MFFSKPGGMITYNRGDVDNADFNKTTLTADGSYHDLDLSSIIPAGTKFVQLEVSIIGFAAGKDVRFKEKGYTGLSVVHNMITPALAIQAFSRFWIGVDKNQKLRYYGIQHAFEMFDVTVVAWKR